MFLYLEVKQQLLSKEQVVEVEIKKTINQESKETENVIPASSSVIPAQAGIQECFAEKAGMTGKIHRLLAWLLNYTGRLGSIFDPLLVGVFDRQ